MRERYEEAGYVLTRIGRPPKRAFLFRTEEPFKKITVNFLARNGGETEKLEFLGDGQQVVVVGIHPDTVQAVLVVRRRAGRDRARGSAVHPRDGSARTDRACRRSAGRGAWLRPRRRRATAADSRKSPRVSTKDDNHEPVDRDKLEAALEVIDSDPYDTWLHVGAALSFELGKSGFEMFDTWSVRSRKYQRDECKNKWNDVRDLHRIHRRNDLPSRRPGRSRLA